MHDSSALSPLSSLYNHLPTNAEKSVVTNFNANKKKKFWRYSNRSCALLLHTTVDDDFIRYAGKTTIYSHMPKPDESEIRNLRERLWLRGENKIFPLQEIAEDTGRKALLSGEALAVLPALTIISTLLVSRRFETNFLFFFFIAFHSGHNLVNNRHKTTAELLFTSYFSIPS